MVEEDKRTSQACKESKTNFIDKIIGTQPNYIDTCTNTVMCNTLYYTGLQAIYLDVNPSSVSNRWRRLHLLHYMVVSEAWFCKIILVALT